MKTFFKGFGIATRLVFEVFFTYLMIVMIGLGFDHILYVGVGAGVIGIAFGCVDALTFLNDMFDKDEKFHEVEPAKSKPPLYYKITQLKGDWYFEVYAQNHAVICVSDSFDTHDGALTGLWYLMEAMKKMDYLAWKTSHSN